MPADAVQYGHTISTQPELDVEAASSDWPDELIVTHSGLRGRSVDLTPATVERVVGGFVRLLRERELPASVAVAHDERPDGLGLSEAATAAVVAAGADVLELGAVSTPTAKIRARSERLGGSLVVTGSHLEPGWNGIKLATAPHFSVLDPRVLSPPERVANRGTRTVDDAAAPDHATTVLASVDAEAIRSARLGATVTGGAGAAGGLLLDELGCRCDGTPDVGLELDDDGDRLTLVDERGQRVDTEATLALVARARRPALLVAGADTSRIVDRVVWDYGGAVRRVVPGELHLVEAVVELGADLAGEGNGGVLRPEVGLFRDGLAAGAAILELLALERRSLSALVDELPRLVRRRSTLPCMSPVAAAVLARLGDVDDVHAGLQVERNGAWALVRLSATEAVLRITAEAETAAAADRLHDELRSALLR